MCLTVDDVPRDGAKLKLWWCLGLPEQKWVMRKDGMIQLEGYNACLDVRKESERVRLTKGPFGEREKELQVWNCMDGSEQQSMSFHPWGKRRGGKLINSFHCHRAVK